MAFFSWVKCSFDLIITDNQADNVKMFLRIWSRVKYCMVYVKLYRNPILPNVVPKC